MNKINIPKTELYASTLTCGTEYFGSTVSRDVCMELTDHDLKAGGNVIDASEFDVRWLPGGEHQSEKVNQSVPVFALIGPKILDNLNDSSSCANTKLSDEDIEYLECGARI